MDEQPKPQKREPLQEQHVKDYQGNIARTAGKENEQRVRDSYNRKFSPEQLKSLGKLENAARGIYGNTKRELSGLGVEVKEMRGDPRLGRAHYRGAKERATILGVRGEISKEDESRVNQLFAKMDALEETGLIPDETRHDKSAGVRTVTRDPLASIGERIWETLQGKRGDNRGDHRSMRFNPSPSFNLNRTQNEDVKTYRIGTAYLDDYQILLEVTKEIEERAGITFKEVLSPASASEEAKAA